MTVRDLRGGGDAEIAGTISGWWTSRAAVRLLEEPLPSSGRASCVRPYQLARTADGALRVVIHLDTLVSIEGVFSEVVSETRCGHARSASSVLETLDEWSRDLRA